MTPTKSAEDEDVQQIDWKAKLESLKRKTTELEKENDQLTVKLHRARKAMTRMRAERTFIFSKLEEVARKSDKRRATEKVEAQGSDNEADSPSDGLDLSDEETVQAKTKVEKDPNAPKRPSNAFFMYCQMQRTAGGGVSANSGDTSLNSMTKRYGQEWKAMPEDEKKKYYDMYAKDKERYKKELAEYTGKPSKSSSASSNARSGSPAPSTKITIPSPAAAQAPLAEATAAAAPVNAPAALLPPPMKPSILQSTPASPTKHVQSHPVTTLPQPTRFAPPPSSSIATSETGNESEDEEEEEENEEEVEDEEDIEEDDQDDDDDHMDEDD